MLEGVTAYPLSWPAGRGRRPEGARKFGQFGSVSDNGHGWKSKTKITVEQAWRRIMDEIKMMRAGDLIISSNIPLRRDGYPRSEYPRNIDPAAAVYFSHGGRFYGLGCDLYTDPAQNLAAIASHLEATRAILRYGVATAEEMFTGFAALPGPSAKRRWWAVLGIREGDAVDEAIVRARWSELARQHHPDRPGGDAGRMAEINAARDEALADLAASHRRS
jgi:hypothetical protein